VKRDNLSDADYERLADLAEQGFAPSSFHIRRRGRPSLGASGASPRVATRVSANVHERAKARAASEGKTMSQALRDLVEDYANGPKSKRAIHR
jgi:predicted DNA-binding protein